MVEKVVKEIKRRVQSMYIDEVSRYWPKVELSKARDQFEYDE